MTAVSLVLLSGALATAAPQPALRLAGNDTTVWVAESRAAGAGPLIRFYYGDTLSPGLITSPTLPDRVGNAAGLAVDDARAVVFYADGSTTPLSIRSDAVGPNWPGTRPPLAVAGDATRSDIYGIGEGSEMEFALALPAAPPTTAAARGRIARGRRQATTRPAAGLTLVRLRGRMWEAVGRLPEQMQGSGRLWMSARDGHVHVFWRERESGPISCSSLVDGAWSEPQAVPESADAEAWASADRIGPVLALLDRSGGALRVAWRKEEAWHISQTLSDAEGTLRLERNRVAAGVARGKLAIARLRDDGRVELGESALDGDRTVAWHPTLTMGGGPLRGERSGGMGWIEVLAIMIVMGVVVWSRQEMLTRPLALPRTLAIAHPGRRLLAGVVDLIPAAVLTAPLWLPPLSEFSLLAPRLLDDPELAQALLASRVAPPWYLLVAAYAGYCALFEWMWGTSPGKLLLGCRVIGATGERPTPAQVLVRNAVRVPELGIMLVGASSAFLMLAISRNGQRMGDAAAGTFVVRSMPPLARPARAEGATREEEEAEIGA